MFPGFTERDFDAYAASKWRSNAYNRERLEVKEKLAALAHRLAPGMVSAGGGPLRRDLSVEHPALWNHKQVDSQMLLFSRDEAARRELDRIMERGRGIASLLEDTSPLRSHLFLTVTLWVDHLLVGLRLPADATVDRDNLRQLLNDHQERDELLALLVALPAGFAVAVDERRAPAAEATAKLLGELLDALEQPRPPGQGRWMTVGMDWPRGDVIGRGAAIADDLAAALRAVLPCYQRIAWSRDNDRISMRETLREVSHAKARRGLDRGDRVRIVSGIFTGRTGTIAELDDKGGVKLSVGPLRLDLRTEDIEKL